MTTPDVPESAPALTGAQPSPRRRRLLYAGVAGAAALGGAGLAWWNFQPHAMESGVEQALWDRARMATRLPSLPVRLRTPGV